MIRAALDHQSAQLLLQIIGRDTIAIGRKFKEAWQGRLSVKVIITTNELPNLQDAGGVLASRFIMLDFKQSFFGREDVNLREKLEVELPGIANRCLAAYRRLRERGRLIQPKAGLSLVERVEAKVNPYAAFMRDSFVPGERQGTPRLFSRAGVPENFRFSSNHGSSGWRKPRPQLTVLEPKPACSSRFAFPQPTTRLSQT